MGSEKWEMMIKALGGVVLIVLCIGAGVYAEGLNPSKMIELSGMTASLAGIAVGIGMALAGVSLILLAMGENATENLENAEIPDQSNLHYIRNFLQGVSRQRGGLVALLIIGLLPPVYWIARPLYMLRTFKPHLPEYVALASATAPHDSFPVDNSPEVEEDDDKAVAPVQPDFGGNNAEEVARETRERNEILAKRKKPVPSNLPVNGKIMPVDVNKEIIDPVFFNLSTDFRPARPEEVGAVAALWWWEQRVGHYGSGDRDTHGAFQQHCTVMVWDKATKSLLAQQSFVGGPPPRTSYYGDKQSGSRPYDEIGDFLNHLPHR
jgi:hypothetical protein